MNSAGPTRETDTEGAHWAHARMAAMVAVTAAGIEGLAGGHGWHQDIPWWRSIPLSEQERVALATLQLLVAGGTIRTADPRP